MVLVGLCNGWNLNVRVELKYNTNKHEINECAC